MTATDGAAAEIPGCAGPDPRPDPPAFTPPPGACDAHFHVFGPSDRFPFAPDRRYTPPDSPLEDYLVLMEKLGIERGVVVHPNLHGSDNAATLDAVARSDGRFLAIVGIDAAAGFEDLKRLDALGARGVRFAFKSAARRHLRLRAVRPRRRLVRAAGVADRDSFGARGPLPAWPNAWRAPTFPSSSTISAGSTSPSASTRSRSACCSTSPGSGTSG